ncbi:hypothetical protein [Nocardioides dongkuii]|uniref:hypothetical protein n=1 Tax=Nocardioides dongkuii TaxID=2760089 RepID=UPI00187799E8|nr:hypothetical protein [Nocardioides dongkuii]
MQRRPARTAPATIATAAATLAQSAALIVLTVGSAFVITEAGLFDAMSHSVWIAGLCGLLVTANHERRRQARAEADADADAS